MRADGTKSTDVEVIGSKRKSRYDTAKKSSKKKPTMSKSGKKPQSKSARKSKSGRKS